MYTPSEEVNLRFILLLSIPFNKDQLLKERICSSKSKLFSVGVDSFFWKPNRSGKIYTQEN